jgi:LuxR family maltose regulon positive regulatory protein
MPSPRSRSVVGRSRTHRSEPPHVLAPDPSGVVRIPEGGAPFGLLDWKLTVPPDRPGFVIRDALCERLMSSEDRFVSVSAPAGYGKSTLLAQWARRDGRPFGWVSLDRNDNDPAVMIAYITAALEAVGAPVADVFESLASPAASFDRRILRLLERAVAAVPGPFVLVLEDVQLVTDAQCHEVIAYLAARIPDRSMLAVAGRRRPPIHGLPSDVTAMKIGRRDLEMDDAETVELVRSAGADLPAGELAALRDRAERWPVALYLAARSATRGADGGGHVLEDDHEHAVSDYVAEELLAGLSDQETWFLTHTAVLEWMSPQLCDAVVQRQGSSVMLAELASSNLLLVPFGDDGVWFRYHGLLRDVLLSHLDRHDPSAVPALHRRASEWYEQHAMIEAAVHHAQHALDAARSARLVTAAAMPAYFSGRVATVERWLDWFDGHGSVDEFPALAVVGALISALRGRPLDAERWADAAGRGGQVTAAGDSSIDGLLEMMRAAMCSGGAEQMLRDASRSLDVLPASSVWRSAVTVLQGVGQLLCGHVGSADATFERGARLAAESGLTDTEIVALSERSVIAARNGDDPTATALARRAHSLLLRGNLDGYATMGLTYAVAAQASLRQGDDEEARVLLARGEERVLPLLTYALPCYAVQSRLEFARAYLGLSDTVGADRMLSQVEEVFDRRPDLGVLRRETSDVAAQLQQLRGRTLAASRVTAAELRVLPFLPGHLSFREIAGVLHLSQYTVKTQAISIYRKLGASSRREAVDAARALGLLEGDPEAR